MKVSKDLSIIYLFSTTIPLFSILNKGYYITPYDTPTYLSAWDSLMTGKLDWFRTPVYPLFLGIIKHIAASKFELTVNMVQYVFMLISVYCFYHIAQRLKLSKTIVFWTTLFYGTCPSVFYWCRAILTESLSISFLVFLVFCLFRLYDHYSIKWAVTNGILLLILQMLRPSFIYLLPLYAVFFFCLYFDDKKRKQAIAGLIGTCVAISVIIGYMSLFRQQYGIFATSSVSTINRLYIARQYGLLIPNDIENAQLRKDLQLSISNHGICRDGEDNGIIFGEILYYINNYDLKTLNIVLNQSLQNYPKQHLYYTGVRFVKSIHDDFIRTLGNYVIFDLLYLYVFMLIYGILLFIWIIKHHTIPLLSSILYFAVVGNILISIIGAQLDWGRLLSHSIPLVILLFGQFCSLAQQKSLARFEMV